MNYAFIILFLLSLNACSFKKASSSHHPHTMKLQKSLSVAFNSIDSITFLIDPLKHEKMTVKIFAVTENKEKTLLASKDINNSGDLTFTFPNEVEHYSYAIALIEGFDFKGNKISSVATYKIGEQEQINQAKKRISNN